MNPTDQPPILEADQVSKRYGSLLALDNLSLAVRPGEVAGLLGPNGAGKTTALSILSTLMRPDSGRVLIRGQPPARGIGRLLGLVPQTLALYPSLSAAQNVWHFARMQGLSRHEAADACARVLTEVGLADRARDPISALSGGMKRRVNLACGLVHRPAVLLLDEPTVGVDIESREQILSLVRRLAQAGSAVIYSTHYMEEVERVCDRVLLLDRGKLVADGSVDKLIALAGSRPRMQVTYRGRLPAGWSTQLAGVREVSSAGEGQVTVEMTSLAQVGDVIRELQAAGAQVLDFTLHSPNLADAYVALTGRALRGDDNREVP